MNASKTFRVEPLDATFGAVVTGLQLTELDAATFDELYATWLEYALLIFPAQHLTAEEQLELTKRFGDLHEFAGPVSNVFKPDGTRVDDDQEVSDILEINASWHCDTTFCPVQTKGSVMTARAVPSDGGQTGWADMAAAYDVLDEGTKARIADLSVYHSVGEGARRNQGYYSVVHAPKPPLRPLVKIHPETGRASLLIGRHAYSIAGMELDESRRFLQDLVDSACQPPRTYHHTWSPGDAAVFDNRRLLHRSRPWDMTEERTLYVIAIAGDPTTEFAAHA